MRGAIAAARRNDLCKNPVSQVAPGPKDVRMLLSRIARQLREHDWTAVIIEIAIVVVGVFIGLQVSNWNDDRKDSVRGDEYLRRLHDELVLDAGQLREISAFWSQVHDYGAAALAYAEDGQLHEGSAWRTLLAYYQSSQVWPYRKPDVTFQEIRSSGHLALIRNQALRARIATHYGAGAGSQVVEVLGLIPKYRESVRGMTPWHVQQYIWSHCYEANDARQTLKDCASPVSEAQATAVIEGYRRSPELTAELRFWMVNINNGLTLMEGIRPEAEALARDVASEATR
jgi:hypothetical protein